MKKHFAFILSFMLSATTFALVSCVNKDYDLSKPIDLEMNIGGKLEMPLKMEQDFSYRLGDLISMEGNDVVKVDPNGDYKFVIKPSEGFSAEYSFADFDIPPISVQQQSNGIVFPPESVGYKKTFNLSAIQGDSAIEVTDIDTSIKKLGKIFLKDTYLYLSLKPSSSTLIADFEQGIVMTLPDNMNFSDPQLIEKGNDEVYGDIFFDEVNPNVLKIPSINGFNTGFTIRCRINCIEVEKVVAGSLNIPVSFSIEFPGESSIKVEQSGVEFSFIGKAVINSIKVDNVEVVAEPQLSCPDVSMNIDAPEDFKEGGSFDFELEDLCFNLIATNNTPFDFKLSTDLVSYNGGIVNTRKSVGGDGSELIVPAGTADKSFYISESGKYGEAQPGEKVVVPGLTDLVSPIPDKFAIENIKVTGPDVDVDKAEYTTLNLGEKYSVAVNYSLETPFSFKKVSFKTEQVAALGVDLGNVGFNDLYLAASVVNTLPLDIDLDCQMLDDAGQVVENVEVLVVILDEAGNAIDYVPAGSIETPATYKLRLAFVSKDSSALTAIQQLKINIIASSPEGTVATLNANQSLVISDFVVGTESGIYINPESNKNE